MLEEIIKIILINMGLLYKDPKDFVYSANFETTEDGKIKIQFSCDGGKFGTDELLDEYKFTVKELLTILRRYNTEKDSYILF